MDLPGGFPIYLMLFSDLNDCVVKGVVALIFKYLLVIRP